MLEVTAILDNGDIVTHLAVDAVDAGQQATTFYLQGAELVSITRDSDTVCQLEGY